MGPPEIKCHICPMLGCCVGYVMSCALISLLGITKVSTNNGCHKDEAKKSFIVHLAHSRSLLYIREARNCQLSSVACKPSLQTVPMPFNY